MYRKTASFLGAAGASLVDLDDLFSSNPKPGQRPLITALAAHTQAIGKDGERASLWVTNSIHDFMWNYSRLTSLKRRCDQPRWRRCETLVTLC